MSDTPKDGPGQDRAARNAGKGNRGRQPGAVPNAPDAAAGDPAAADSVPPGGVLPEPALDSPAEPRVIDVEPEPVTGRTAAAEAAGPASSFNAARAQPAAASQPRYTSLGVPLVAGAALVVLLAAWLVYAGRNAEDPVEAGQIAALSTRLDRTEQSAGALPAQLQQLQQKLAAIEAAQGAAVKPEALQALDQRLGRQEATAAEAQRRAEARIADAENALSQRITGAEAQLAQRVAASEAALAPKLAAIDTAQQQRLDALRDNLQQRQDTAARAQQEALSQAQAAAAQQQSKDDERLAALESREARIAAAEQRLNRLVASTAVTTALEAGKPLGAALAGLPGNVPPALSAYSTAAPPTAAQLRLSFEDAARAARAASEPQTNGQGVLEAAATRLSNLVTVRRGDTTVWGDNAAGALEGARQSLDAGDLAGAVQKIEALPPAAKAPMEAWLSQARGLLAARAALADLVTRGQG
jgi:hypothetical protein